MGYEAQCRLTFGGRSYEGRARLEQHELVFRGETRLAIPLKSATEVQASDGQLTLTSAGRGAVFHLGRDADKWAGRITNPPSRARKLGFARGMRIAIVNVRDDDLIREIEDSGAVIEQRASARDLDLIMFGAATMADLDRIGAVAARLTPSGAFWLIRAKGAAAPIKEADSMAAGKRAGLVDVKVVSFSETHSAEKYVVPRARRPLRVAKPAQPARPTAPSPRSRGSAPSRART